jgi:hypothetical protein
MINIKYNINIIIKGGGFRGNLGSPEWVAEFIVKKTYKIYILILQKPRKKFKNNIYLA